MAGPTVHSALRFPLVFFAALLVVLGGQAGWGVYADWRAYRRDLHRDHRLMGTALGEALGRVWTEQGRSAAEEILEDVRLGRVRARLVDRKQKPGAGPFTEEEVRQRFRRDELVTRVAVRTTGDERLAWIELSEPVRSPAIFLARNAWPALFTTLISAILYAGLAAYLGMRSRVKAAESRIAREKARADEAVEELRHADRLSQVGRLAASLAHELGTPLSIVTGRAQMLARGRVEPARVGEVAQIIADEGNRVADMIRQLLDYSRKRSGQEGPFDLSERLESWRAVLEPVAKRSNVVLDLELEHTPPVLGDPALLQQVVTNLVVNAIHAMPEKGRVRIRTRDLDEPAAGGPPLVELIVADEGVGMAPEVLARAFEPFFTTKGAGLGTGLGLAVVKGIVDDQGGRIDIESAPGQGTTVRVRLVAATEAA